MSVVGVFIAASARTPIGSFQGLLRSLSATDLGAMAIKAAVSRSGLPASAVQEVIMGNVISAGAGQAPARQTAIKGGLLESTVCTTVNKVCASGMKSIMLAAQSIQLGHQDIVVAGGTESMSNVPFIARSVRSGAGYGHQVLEDLILLDGLTDVYNKFHMGMCGENTAAAMGITRQDQDKYALQSYARAQGSVESGRQAREITPVTVESRRGAVVIAEDEEYKNLNAAKMPTLRTAFKKDGTITAANASKLNDGACAAVIVSEATLRAHALTPLARIVAYADAECAPIDFPIAPGLAIPIALKRAGLTASDISSWEINEAFSVVPLALIKKLDLDPALVNKHGGAVAMGHPIGMSGARITTSLAHQLEPGQYGVAAICNGGGGASAVVIQKL